MLRLREVRCWFTGVFCLLGMSFALLLAAGCQSFFKAESSETSRTTSRSLLSPLKPAENAIQLDVLVIDRHADDPLIGSRLWQELDQVGAVPVETRELLLQNGCRIGRAGATPPHTLLALFGIAEQEGGQAAAGSKPLQPQVAGRTYSLQSGTESDIQVSEEIAQCDVNFMDADRPRVAHFEHARCVMKLKPVRLQDGWIRVELVPEIHHGEMRLRQTPTEAGWAFKSSQNVERCISQRFSVTLNVGEAVVVSATQGLEESLGDTFFRRSQDGDRRQRVMIVRLADMGRSNRAME